MSILSLDNIERKMEEIYPMGTNLFLCGGVSGFPRMGSFHLIWRWKNANRGFPEKVL